LQVLLLLLWLTTHIFDRKAAKSSLAALKIKMHDPRQSYIYMSKDSLLQCMHEAAAKHGTPSISPISLQCKRKLGFNFVEPLLYGRSWPWSQSERGKSNLE
jgi:hypothetical protein